MLGALRLAIPKRMNLIGVIHDEHVSDHPGTLPVSLPIGKVNYHGKTKASSLFFGPRIDTRRTTGNDGRISRKRAHEGTDLFLIRESTASNDPDSHYRHYSVNFS